MGRNETRRSIGAILMGMGLLLILSIAGYFAWTEVQASEVRHELAQNALQAAARTTDMARTLAQDSPTSAALAAVDSVPTAAAAQSALTVTPRPTRPAATSTPTRRATAARKASATPAAGPTADASDAAAGKVGLAAAESPAGAQTEAPAASAEPVLPVRLVIPDLKIDTEVVEMGWKTVQTKNGPVSEWVIPKDVAGHHLNSAGLGEPENLVLSGHNNILGRVFMPISQAWDNDHRSKVDNFTEKSGVLDGREVILYDAAGNQHIYLITDFYRLKDTGVSKQQRVTNARFIQPTGDERVTIVTCWPPTNNTHRLVLIARPEK